MNAPRLGPNGLLVLAMLLLVPSESSAQGLPSAAAEPRTRIIFSGGLGLGSLDFGGQLSLSVRRGIGDLVFRVAETTEFALLSAPETSRDIAVLYGRRTSGSVAWMRAAAGLGLVHGVRRGDRQDCWIFFCSYVQERHSTLGLALQLDAVWAPLSFLGLGLSFFGNLNERRSFGGVTLNLHLGQVR